MKVVVFGANGRVGQLVVNELAARGHVVRAFVHGEPRQKLDGVEYVRGDIYREVDVQAAIRGMQGVVSCLGSWGTEHKNILETGMSYIVPAMKAAGISRVVSLTGADAWMDDESHSLLQKVMHLIFGVVASKILRDGEAHIRILRASDLNWTVLRSPVMNEKGPKQYLLTRSYPLPWGTVHRHAVAQAMCDQLDSSDFTRLAPYLHRA